MVGRFCIKSSVHRSRSGRNSAPSSSWCSRSTCVRLLLFFFQFYMLVMSISISVMSVSAVQCPCYRNVPKADICRWKGEVAVVVGKWMDGESWDRNGNTGLCGRNVFARKCKKCMQRCENTPCYQYMKSISNKNEPETETAHETNRMNIEVQLDKNRDEAMAFRKKKRRSI